MATAVRAHLRVAICFSCWLWLATESTAQLGFGGTGIRAQGGGVGEEGTGGGGARPFGGGVGTGGTGGFAARALPQPILIGPGAGGIKCAPGDAGVRCLINPCQVPNVKANSPCTSKGGYTCYANYCAKPTTFKGTLIPRAPCSAIYVKTATDKVNKSCSPSIWPPTCVCPKIKKLVCGKNGKTYANACTAKCAGVAIKWYDSCAVCKKCGKKGPKVCGANGKTYLNKCWLKCAGVKLAYAGACKPCVKQGGACDLSVKASKKCCPGSICWTGPVAIVGKTKGTCYSRKGPLPIG